MIVAGDLTRLDGVRVIGVDEHRWAHVRRPGEDGFVTVIVDLTPVLDGTGRARLVPGRSAMAFKDWLAEQKPARLPLISARRKATLEAVFADENHLAVELCWSFYRRIIAAYAQPDRRRGKALMGAVIDALRQRRP